GPGTETSTAAAANLAALPLRESRRLLGELTRASLMTERSPGRYMCHDLLLLYAKELLVADGALGAGHDGHDGHPSDGADCRCPEWMPNTACHRINPCKSPGNEERLVHRPAFKCMVKASSTNL